MKAQKQNALQGVCNRVAGSITAGAVLYRANYWMPRASIDVFDDGRIWIAKRADLWCQETGLTIDTYRRAITSLRRNGLIETTQAYFGRQRITHLRLTDKAIDLIRSEVTAATAGTISSSGRQADKHEDVPSEPVPGRNTQPSDRPERAPLLRKSAHLYEKREDNEERNKDKESGSRGDTAFDREGYTQGFRERRNRIEEVWVCEAGTHFERYVSLTATNRKQLRQFAERCPEGMAEAILTDTIANWQGFTFAAKADAGAFNMPQVPQVEFLLKYTDVAINLSLRRNQAAKERVEQERAIQAGWAERETHTREIAAAQQEHVEAEARLTLACKEITMTEEEENERLTWSPDYIYLAAPPSAMLCEGCSWSEIPEDIRNNPREIAHRDQFIRRVIAPRRGIVPPT